MAVVYNIRAITGTYQKDGEEKSRYQNIGVVFETKSGGLMGKLETVPVNWDGTLFFSEPQYDKKELTHEFNKTMTQDVVLEDIDDKPVDLSAIPF